MSKNNIIGSIFTHPIYGDYKVLPNMEKRKNFKYYEILFLTTGYKVFARKDHIININVKDKKYCKENGILNKIFENKKGQKYRVISVDDNFNYTVEFLDTKTIRVKNKVSVLKGQVWDEKGETISTIYDDKKGKRVKKRSYYLYKAMLQRRNTRDSTVCKEWEDNYINFLNWLKNIELPKHKVNIKDFELGYALQDYELDKDLLGNNKEYSPQNCCLITRDFNKSLRNLTNCNVILTKGGKSVKVTNMIDFLNSLGYEVNEDK